MSQNDYPRPLSDAELDALKALWQAGPQPVSEVRTRLKAEGRNWAYTTTKTILDRLEEKGYVRRERASMPHVYVPIVSAEAVAREQLGRVRREIFDGAGLPMIRALVDGSALTLAEIAELRALLDEQAAREQK